MKTFMFHIKILKQNPRIGPRKIIGTAEFCSFGHVSDRDDVIDFQINYEPVPTKDIK